MEAGCEEYCQIELDDVELQGDRVYLHPGIPGGYPAMPRGPSMDQAPGPVSRSGVAMGRATERPNLSPQMYRSVRMGLSPPYRLARTV
jgi:hypothetical protein